MPRRITNEDFHRALEQTNRAGTTTARPSTIPSQQAPRTSNRRNIISMDHLRNALQRTPTHQHQVNQHQSLQWKIREVNQQMHMYF